LNKTLVKIRRF